MAGRGGSSSHGSSCFHAHRSIPTSRRLPPLPRRTRIAPRFLSRWLSRRSSASLIRSPARPASIPVGRVGSPEDVAQTIAYLISNGYVTGTVAELNGGSNLA